MHEGTVGAVLGAGPPAEAPFGLVFVDPPYETAPDEVARVLSALIEGSWLTGGASAVVERGVGRGGAGRVDVPVGWFSGWERGYGDTLVTVLTAVPGGRRH